MVNGVPITYTLDLAAPLVTVLAEAQLNKRITYLYGLGDSPLASDDGAAWTYLSGRDALNSVRQETDAAGQVLSARSFDPYGVVLSGDGGTPFGWTGEYRDAASGLLFLRARYLQVAEGRFITRDTWPGDDRWPITFNSWAYGGVNPLRWTDPSGHMPCAGEFGCGARDGYPDWWYAKPLPQVPADLNPGGRYNSGTVIWAGNAVDIYLPPFEPGNESQSVSAGYPLTGEAYPNSCPVAPPKGAMHPPVFDLWTLAHRATGRQVDLARSALGGLAGMNGSFAESRLQPYFVDKVDVDWAKPQPEVNKGDIASGAAANLASAASAARSAGLSNNVFILEKNAGGEYRVVIERFPAYPSALSGVPAFLGYGVSQSFDPNLVYFGR